MLISRNRCNALARKVLIVYQQGTVISGVPLMLTVLRCGHSFKFIGHDQAACSSYQGFCYEPEARKTDQPAVPGVCLPASLVVLVAL